ncbi:MAG: c-type cytochrome biogenesis protein CcmI, partial [Maritimibacter sp.]|nr:c-type cytochrome biogenesis protein CcmI [Maritimibacter sp.]
MLGFWIIAATAAIVAIAFIGRALVSGGGEAEAATAAYDLQVYRDQLRELDRDVARGVIEAGDAERARVEISRRLLEADRKASDGAAVARAPRGATYAALGLTVLVVFVGGLGLYRAKGAILRDPEASRFALPVVYPDLPLKARIADAEEMRKSRASQAEIEAELPAWPGPPAEAPADYLELIEKLRATLADNPDSLEGQDLLAQHEAALDNYVAAHAAMARVLALKGTAATAEDYSRYADLLVLAARGRVSPEAEAALNRALALDPEEPIALYYTGLMFAQNERPDYAFRIWRDLLESSDPGAPWVGPIRGQIGQLAKFAGVDYTPPAMGPALAGPTAEDMAAAEDMDAGDRDAMVRGMVERLMDRLATEGGSAAEWAQLIGALGVLGETERAAAIWGEAQNVFAGKPEL